MRRAAFLALLAWVAAWSQVAMEANRVYRTHEGREALARGLGAADRDASQKPKQLIAELGVRPGSTAFVLGTNRDPMLPPSRADLILALDV